MLISMFGSITHSFVGLKWGPDVREDVKVLLKLNINQIIRSALHRQTFCGWIPRPEPGLDLFYQKPLAAQQRD